MLTMKACYNITLATLLVALPYTLADANPVSQEHSH
jgi:hypothetical protein